VTTSGVSMAPRFHSGDLAVVRPADDYKVGQIVAYRSAQLRTVVLHRIIAIKGDRYVFKGDNNDFIDPARPVRADLIGRLTLRVAHGGRILAWLHTPFMAALLLGGTALLVLLGAKQQRRRRDRRRPADGRVAQPSVRPRPEGILGVPWETAVVACTLAAVAFAGLGALAFGRPTTKPATVRTPYTEKVSFGYHARASAGPVYPDGVVKTGDPIFLKLVHRVRIKAHYRLAAIASQRLAGTMEVVLRVTSPTGWNRTIQLAAPKRFTGDYAAADVILDVPALQSLTRRVERLTGGSPGVPYNLAVVPRVRVTGTLAGRPLTSDYVPTLSLQMDALQLRPGAGPPSASGPAGGLTQSRAGTVEGASTTKNALSVRGHDLPVGTARWIAVIGFLIAATAAALGGLGLLGDPADPAEPIRRYRHLIVPIAGTTYDPARPPIDVTSIGALAQLAERSERLILHHHRDGVDTYLVEDEGTLYRYVAPPGAQRLAPLSVVGGTASDRAAV